MMFPFVRAFWLDPNVSNKTLSHLSLLRNLFFASCLGTQLLVFHLIIGIYEYDQEPHNRIVVERQNFLAKRNHYLTS